MKHENEPSSGVLLGMAAGAALGAVSTHAKSTCTLFGMQVLS